MNKVLNFIKKKDIDIIIIIYLIVARTSLFCGMNLYDEMWNFANVYKMFEGYKIYQDLNVIITPLFFYIAQIFLYIFGGSILSFRIYNIVISSTILILVYKILKNLKIIRKRAIAYTTLITVIFISTIRGGANYNMIVIIPILINILLILKNKENDILTGILLFLTFMLKQNVFLFFSIGILIYKIIGNKNIKDIFVSLMKVYLTSAICIGGFFVFLYCDNNLYNFINYCFLGLKEFATNNIIGNIFDTQYIFISIVIAVFFIFTINNKKIKENMGEDKIKNIKVFLSFGIPLIFIAYPIYNDYHCKIACLVLMIGFIYFIEETLIKEFIENTKKDITLYWRIIIIPLILYSIYGIIYIILSLSSSNYYFDKEHPYFGYMATQDNINDINIICKYIKESNDNGVEVKILSYKANLYMIPLGKNNGIFDLANLGNLGKKGEEGLIEEIKNLRNSVILIETKKDENMIDQESEKAREYIVSELEKIGEIQEYSIYKSGN